MRKISLAVAGLLIALPLLAGPLDDSCVTGPQPAATLLVPYLEVELDDAGGLTTLFAVGNHAEEPVLAHVVLWTDWKIPTLAFDIYLEGKDLHTVNLRDVFRGELPVTGSGTAGDPFPGCGAQVAAPLSASEAAALRAQHSGRESPADGLCWSSGREGPNVATGYLTIDVVNDCSATIEFPPDDGYFEDGGAGLASNANVLWGDVFIVEPDAGFAQGFEPVHVVADEDRFIEGEQTFYQHYSRANDGTLTAADDRAPLSTRSTARFLTGGGFDAGTELILWLDNGVEISQPVSCSAGEPSWSFDEVYDPQIRIFDEDGEEGELGDGQSPDHGFLLTQKIEVGGPLLPVPFEFGYVDFAHRTIPCAGCGPPPIAVRRQATILPVASAESVYSVSWRAIATDDGCQTANTPVPADG